MEIYKKQVDLGNLVDLSLFVKFHGFNASTFNLIALNR